MIACPVTDLMHKKQPAKKQKHTRTSWNSKPETTATKLVDNNVAKVVENVLKQKILKTNQNLRIFHFKNFAKFSLVENVSSHDDAAPSLCVIFAPSNGVFPFNALGTFELTERYAGTQGP